MSGPAPPFKAERLERGQSVPAHPSGRYAEPPAAALVPLPAPRIPEIPADGRRDADFSNTLNLSLIAPRSVRCARARSVFPAVCFGVEIRAVLRRGFAARRDRSNRTRLFGERPAFTGGKIWAGVDGTDRKRTLAE